MKIKRLIIALLISAFTAGSAYSRSLPEISDIEKALDYQTTVYPLSHLSDVYKNFFQDYFGPGHILSDTVAAKAYLNRELNETDQFPGPDFEPTGASGNFVRVNLSLINKGIIPNNLYFKKFSESITGIEQPAPEEWIETWRLIDSVIQKQGLKFTDEDADREIIEEKLRNHDFVMHHSDDFNRAYNFHYRIFSRRIFEQDILPLILPGFLPLPKQ